MTAKVSSLLFGAAVSLVACGCSPELSKRYSSARFPQPDPARHPVLFSVFTLPVPDSTTAQTISSLSAEGQAEAVKALAAKYTAPNAFLAALAQPLQPASEPAKVVETSSVSRRIVINLVDQAERPAERIQYALVTVYIPAEKDGRLPAKFVSWNAFSTRSETVDYGTTKLKRDFSATANVKTGPIPSYEIGEAGGSATATRSMEEERKIVPRLHDAAPCRRRHQSTLFSSSPVKRPAERGSVPGPLVSEPPHCFSQQLSRRATARSTFSDFGSNRAKALNSAPGFDHPPTGGGGAQGSSL